MKILVISDVHGVLPPVIKLLKRMEDVDLIIFLGDGIDGVEHLAKSFSNIPFKMVPGNCDYSSRPVEQLIELEGRKIFFTHGHEYSVKHDLALLLNRGKSLGAHLIMFGHTHRPYEGFKDGVYLLNPGSTSRPSCGYRPSYATVEIREQMIVTNVCEL